jgi:hypothetical protein
MNEMVVKAKFYYVILLLIIGISSCIAIDLSVVGMNVNDHNIPHKRQLELFVGNYTSLSYEQSIKGSVSNTTDSLNISLYKVTIPYHRYIQTTYLLITLEKTSNSHEIIYLDLYYLNLTRISNGLNFTVYDMYSSSLDVYYNDVETDEVFIVIYGNGEYKLFINEESDPIFYLSILYFSIICGMVIFLLIIGTFSIYTLTYYLKNRRKKLNTVKIVDMKKKMKNSVKTNIIIKYFIYLSYFIGISMIISSIVIIQHVEILDLRPPQALMLISFIFFISIIIFGFLFGILLFISVKIHINKQIMKTDKKLNYIYMDNVKPFKERFINIGMLFWLSPMIIYLLITWILFIYRIYKLFDFDNYCGILGIIIFAVMSICLILYFILLYYLSKIKLNVTHDRIEYRMGIFPKSYLRKDIQQIRPINASIFMNMNTGLGLVNGKWKSIKTGVALVMKDGSVKTILTSRPMDIIYLLDREGEDFK